MQQQSSTKQTLGKKPLSGRKSSDLFARYFPEEIISKRPDSTTIAKPMSQVYQMLREVGNFPMFFENLEKVEPSSETQAQWYFRGDTPFSVPMKIETESNGENLVWKSTDAAGFSYTVAIQLEPAQAGRGTVARMMVAYDTTAGKLAGLFEKLFGADAAIVSKKNLQRFKCFCETGNVPTIEGQSSGRDEDQSPSMKH